MQDEDIVLGLPKYCRYIEGHGQFFDEKINEKLKHQKFFMIKSDEMNELLKKVKYFSFDATFSCTGWAQLAVLCAHVDNPDPLRQKTTVTVAYAFQKSKECDVYVEFFDTFKEKLYQVFYLELSL